MYNSLLKSLTIFLVMTSFLTLNVKGLVSQQKQMSLLQFVNNTNASIIFLQETNLKQDSAIIHPEKFHFFINPPVQPSSGCAIAIKSELYEEIEIVSHQILTQGYLQAVQIKINKNEVFHLVNVYMPHDHQLSEEVANKINNYIENIKDEEKIILSGDWNATLEKEDRRNCNELRTHLANKLKLIVTQHNLSDVWRVFNPNSTQFTFRGLQQNHPMARLDRIYIKKRDLNLTTSIQIIPAFSDHSAVIMKIIGSKPKYKPPYWKLDTTLLKSEEYQEIITNILNYFEEKSQQPTCDINILWDQLKEEVKIASQRFTKHLNQKATEQLSLLQAQFHHISSKNQLSSKDEQILIQIEKEISQFYKSSSTNKLQLFETQICKEANTQSKFFLRLAKKATSSLEMDQLEVDGEVTTDNTRIFPFVQQTFASSFSDEDMNQVDPSNRIYQDLPKLSQCDREFCEKDITEKEIEESIKQAQLNRAPGFDGLPIEFYKLFWSKLKVVFMKLVKNFEETGELPRSMKKIIIRPIPKKGDRLKLKNWRPISLMNTDYKIISRVYSRRISCVVSTLLSSDQSYCVPGKTIYDNLHLIRNVITHSNQTNSPLAILSLDQTEAFNKVSHQYLFHLLQTHNFGPKLVKAITSLLTNKQGYIKIGAALLAPFLFKIGVRQGDPIAGPLYIIIIEPFLRLAVKLMSVRGYLIPQSIKTTKCTAFADDVNFFITQDRDFETIKEAYRYYSQQSGAQLNEAKSSGLFCGQWKNRMDKPIECEWNSEGSKFLGVYLGNEKKYEEQNWQQLSTKIKGTLNRWSQFVKLTSLIGRKIICNQLVGSLLIHTANVLQPPKIFIQEVQRELNNFVWQGKHWVHSNYLYAPQEKGGIDLINIQAKILCLRLSLAHRIQQNFYNKKATFLFHHYNLSRYGNIDPQLFFCQKKQEVEMANLDIFYQSVLVAWHNINPSPITTTIPIKILRKMPLRGSKLIEEDKLRIVPDWNICGFTTLEKILEENGNWKTLQLQHLPISQQRRLSFNYNQIKIYFSKKMENLDPSEILNQTRFQFDSPYQKKPNIFPATKKTLYLASLNSVLTKPEITGKSRITPEKINWTALYAPPIDRRDSDVSWRLLHDALVTPKKLQQWNVISEKNCPWCHNKEGDVIHMIFQCRAAAPLWTFASSKITTILGSQHPISLHQAIVGFPPTTSEGRLSNFLLSLVKSTIYRTYMNYIKEESPPLPAYLQIFKKRIDYRIKLEEVHAELCKTTESYKTTFLINQALSPPPSSN